MLEALAEVPVTDDGTCRPLRNVRIKAAEVLEDPFPELEQAEEAAEFVARQRKLEEEKRKKEAFLEEEENVQVKEEMEELKRKEARSRATVLEMVGDLPDADMAPPENVLFVCKLNPVTKAEDLEIIFGRFGEIKSCEVVRDWKTGDSLQYAFIEFQTPQQCEQAYSKMDNVLIDDRRIHVDFSQSVAKMWTDWRRGSIKRKIPEKNPHTTQRTNTFEFTGSSVSRAQKFRQRSPPQRSRRHFSPDRERRTRKRSRERSPSPTYSHRRSDADRSRERYWPSRKTEARDDYRGRRFRSRS